MEQIKRKRGRPRKTQLPEEIQKIVEEVKAKESLDTSEIIEQAKETLEDQRDWDIRIDQQIDYFDPNLSYELTGYKPINDSKGLDFNPEWFTEAREIFKRTGHYCEANFNSRLFKKYWNDQFDKCRNGMTSHGYTITGDHYFFLNFYRLPNLKTAKAGIGRTVDFPDFYVAQYQWFHYLEMCKRLRKNAALMKARGLGFSEMNASLASNMYTVRDNATVAIIANLSKYVEDTLSKVWNALSFLNDSTDDGFSQLAQVTNTAMMRKASYIESRNGIKVEAGSKSIIKGIVADSPNKIRGDRCDLLLYEEGGSWLNSTKAFIQGDALIHIQGEQFGYKVIGGTGGDSGARLEGLRTIFYDPNAFNVLPYKHHYSATGQEVLTGFFLPAFAIVKGEYMDNRGYTSPEKGREYYDKQRARFIDSPKDLITFSAEFCYTPEDAFNLEGDNKFNKNNIAEQLARIRVLKENPKIESGYLEYTFKNNQHTELNINGFRWKPDANSKLQILEHPLWTLEPEKDPETGEFIRPKVDKMRGLYVVGIDGIDIGAKQTSEFTKDPSDFCLIVLKRAYGMSNPQIVALYKDRPDDVRDAYKIAIKVAQYYNASINLEATRTGLLTWARDRKYLGYFMKRPRATLGDIAKGRTSQYGTPATQAIINHQTDLIADFVNDYCSDIWFEEVLDELNRYTDENKRKFDIVAAFAMSLLADEELSGTVPRKIENVEDTWEDIGYYIDEYGYKRKGRIPKRSQSILVNDNFSVYDDYAGNRTSDPRSRTGYLS